jgi:predicted  nucleic acid-binding Zn-ribbon protein
MPPEHIDVTIARLDERLRSFQEVLGEMAADQKMLTKSYGELVKSNERISLTEAAIKEMRDSQTKLWSKLDAHVEAHEKSKGSALYDIGKLVAAVAIGVILAKFGIHLP